MIKRFQNKIAESRKALPIVSVLCGALWIFAGLHDNTVWPVFGCVVLATYLMVELNNTNALIRIYSRMVSCAFLVFMTMASFEYRSLSEAVIVLCLVGFYLALFKCYQDNRATGWTFYAFLCLGLASVMSVHVLFYLPVLWIIMASSLLSMSAKTFFASLFGIITPYWFLAAFYAITNDFNSFILHFESLAEFGKVADYTILDTRQIVTISLLLISAIIGSVHFINTSTNDKIRTRKLYEIFIIIDVISFIFLALQPQHYDMLLGLITINTSPLIAHYISLTHTKITNIVTITLIILAIIVTAYNTWMPLLTFL